MRCTAVSPPPGAEYNIENKECKKRDQYKKVNMSVSIVKIIPGQEFISNHCYDSHVAPPGRSFQFSSNLALALSAPDLAGRVQATNHRYIRRLSNIGGWHRGKRSRFPGTESKCVFNHAQASYSFQGDLPPATSSGGSGATRPRGCAPAAGPRGASHKATRTQWCLSLQGSTPLLSW